jgi:hypothetical protein
VIVPGIRNASGGYTWTEAQIGGYRSSHPIYDYPDNHEELCQLRAHHHDRNIKADISFWVTRKFSYSRGPTSDFILTYEPILTFIQIGFRSWTRVPHPDRTVPFPL